MDHPPTESLNAPGNYWLSLEHSCGCILDYGVDARIADQLGEFLSAAAPYPCPMHGSTTGIKEPPLRPNEVRPLVACGVYYRAASEDQHENAKRNRVVALGRSASR